MVEVTVGRMEAGKKLHRWLRQLLPGVPLSGIYKMIRTGRVKVNGKRGKTDTVLSEGDVVRLYMSEADFASVRKSEKKFHGVPTDIDIVYEDGDMLVVNKPAGILVHGAPGEYKDTLTNRVLAHLYHRGDLIDQRFTPAPVHRLDRNTSGLVIFAKTAEASRNLAQAMASHTIRKWYAALVCGTLPDHGVIRAELVRDRQGVRTLVREGGKSSETRYRVVARSGGTSAASLELVSGRTHQIRAHLAHIGHPLVGDFKYGGPRALVGLSRRTGQSPPHHWLHAVALEFPDGRRLVASIPPEFREMMRRFGYRDDDIIALESPTAPGHNTTV